MNEKKTERQNQVIRNSPEDRSPSEQAHFSFVPSTDYHSPQANPTEKLRAIRQMVHSGSPLGLTARLCSCGVTVDVPPAGFGRLVGVTVSTTTVTAVLVDRTPLLVMTS